MIKDIYINGNAFSKMTVEQREKEKNKHKTDKDNYVSVNVLSEHMFIIKVSIVYIMRTPCSIVY